jgi:hypothetical protein
VAFFAPEREGIAWLPVYERDDPADGWSLRLGAAGAAIPSSTSGPRPLFFGLPADIRDATSATVPLYEYRSESSGQRFYSTEGPISNARAVSKPRILGRVWRNPSRLRLW